MLVRVARRKSWVIAHREHKGQIVNKQDRQTDAEEIHLVRVEGTAQDHSDDSICECQFN